MVRKIILGLGIFLMGFFVFWFPSFVGHAISGKTAFSYFAFPIIFICPLITSVLMLSTVRKRPVLFPKPIISFLFLMGIWFLGPLATMADASFSDGGFALMWKEDSWKEFLLSVPQWPGLTFISSTYDGTLGSLLVFSLVVIVQLFVDFLSFLKNKKPAEI